MTQRIESGSDVDIAAQSCCFSAPAGLGLFALPLAIDAGIFSTDRVGLFIMPHD